MGSGRWDNDNYTRSRAFRRSSGQDDFHYSSTSTSDTQVHPSLNPMRIKDKPFHKLESRDSAEHPDSNSVFVCLDVTGSNAARARDAQAKLPNLFGMLGHYLNDPQVLFAANDDVLVEGRRSIQIGEFESDNRVDEQLRSILLTSNGGGNDRESYDLVMWAAAYKTVLDCAEKRNRKGYFFLYADEVIPPIVQPDQVQLVFGERIPEAIPIETVLEELRKQYYTFVIWPHGGYDHARARSQQLFGRESTLILQHPNLICELICSVIGLNESRVTADAIGDDLVRFGADPHEARLIQHAVREIRLS